MSYNAKSHGEAIANLLEFREMSVNDLAHLLNMSLYNTCSLIADNIYIDITLAMKIETAININHKYLLELQDKKE